MIVSEKQSRAYLLIGLLIVVALLAAQFLIDRSYEAASEEVVRQTKELEQMKASANARYALFEQYRAFEAIVNGDGGLSKSFPLSALDLYTTVDRALADNQIEHTNRSSSSGAKGGAIQLQVSFSGSYYGMLRALSALRNSDRIMRISEIRIAAEDGEKVSGTMTIQSVARAR